MEINHLPENSECFKVLNGKAYFQINGVSHFHEFETERKAEEWKQKRSIENRRSKTFEYFMAVDEYGILDYVKYYKLHSSIGIVPPDPYCLQMLYALDEMTGKERDYLEEEDTISEMLIANQLSRKPAERKSPTAFTMSNDRKFRLKQLTDASNLPENFGELFLNEIKLSTNAANEHLRTRAKLLGLF